MSKKIEPKNAGKAPARFWNIAEGDDEGVIELYGDVLSEKPRDWWTGEDLEGNYITPEGFAEDLERIKNKARITVKINSVGGDAYTGIAIHNALKSLAGTKTVIVDGIAASAASIIAMAGDVIKMYPGSLMMIHGVSGLLSDWYTIGDLKKAYKRFDAIERAMAAIYSIKTGLSVESLRTMMEKETWMTGEDAVAKKFADEIEGPGVVNMAYSAASRILVVNGVKHRADGLQIPKSIKINELAVTAAADANDNEPESKESGEPEKMADDKVMTVDTLRAQYPELVAQIEAAAVEKDRARIMEIEEIQDSIGDAQMIAQAKFTKPTNAAALALDAMKKHAALGQDYAAKRAAELASANVAGVQAAAQMAADPADLAKATKAQQQADEKQALERVGALFSQVYNK